MGLKDALRDRVYSTINEQNHDDFNLCA